MDRKKNMGMGEKGEIRERRKGKSRKGEKENRGKEGGSTKGKREGD